MIVEKSAKTIEDEQVTASTTWGSRIRTIVMWGYAVLFLYYVFTLGPNNSEDLVHNIPAGLVLIMLTAIYGLQQYTSLHLKTDADEKYNEYGKNESNRFWVYFLFLGALALNWHLFNKNATGLILAISAAVVVLTYNIYASSSLVRTSTLNKLFLGENALNVPVYGLFFSTAIWFALVMLKGIFVVADLNKFKEIIKNFLIFIPPAVIAYQMGASACDTRHHQRMLVVTKLVNLMNVIDAGWVYHDIVSARLENAIDQVVKVGGQTLSADQIHGMLMVNERSILTTYGLKDQTPLDLWNTLEDYIKTQKNKKFSMRDFLSASRRNADPLTVSGALVPFNSGIVMLVITSVIVLGWAYLTKYGGFWKSVGVFRWGLLLGGCALFAYIAFTLREISHTVDSRNEVFCLQNKLDAVACTKTRPQFEQSSFYLLDRINTLKAGYGDVTINGYTIYQDLGDNTSDNRNMRTTYVLLSHYPSTDISISDLIGSYKSSFNYLVSAANEVGLKNIDHGADIKFFTGSDTPIYDILKLENVSLADVFNAVNDDSFFAQSLGLVSYAGSNKAFATDNQYFGLFTDSSQNMSIYFNYQKNGTDFKKAVIDVMRTRLVLGQMMYAGGPDFRQTISPALIKSLYDSGTFDITNDSGKHIKLLKDVMRAELQPLLKDAKTYDDAWNVLASTNASWSTVKSTMTGTSYDLISKVLQSPASGQDKTILTDVLMHAISPRPQIAYDVYVNDYLDKLFWTVKLEAVQDNSPIIQDVATISSKYMLPIILSIAALVLVFTLVVKSSLRVEVDTIGYFEDYFKTSVAGSKLGTQHNPMLLLVVMLILSYTLFNYISLTQLESRAVSTVNMTNTPGLSGTTSLTPLTVSVCALLMFIPLYYSVISERGNIFYVTLLLGAMMCTPLIKFLDKTDKAKQLTAVKKMNSISLLVVFSIAFFLVINKSSEFVTNPYFRYGLYGFTVVIAFLFSSLPMVFYDVYSPDLDEKSLDNRINKINTGVYISFGLYAVVAFLYFTILRKESIFTNEINEMQLPKGMTRIT